MITNTLPKPKTQERYLYAVNRTNVYKCPWHEAWKVLYIEAPSKKAMHIYYNFSWEYLSECEKISRDKVTRHDIIPWHKPSIFDRRWLYG